MSMGMQGYVRVATEKVLHAKQGDVHEDEHPEDCPAQMSNQASARYIGERTHV